MKVVCVLRSGGEYMPDHVRHLQADVERHLKGACFVCLSDVPVEGVKAIRLRHDWPGWWSKMELFAPWIEGDVLFFDLDTAIVGDLSDIAAVSNLTLLRDFYRPQGLGSGVMMLPAACRAEIWAAWTANPTRFMRDHLRGGDQAFLERFWLRSAKRWQDAVPGQVVSYKVHCRQAVPSEARVVCFHGRPRPWEVQDGPWQALDSYGIA